MTNRFIIVKPGKGGGSEREGEREVWGLVWDTTCITKKGNGKFYGSKASQSVPARPSGEGNLEAR